MTAHRLTLQDRVRQFNLGTPTPMHVGTHELVNDLWRELEKRSENHVALAAEQKREGGSSTGDHTPGKLFVRYDIGNEWQVGRYIGDGEKYVLLAYDLTEEEARLIAAAPDMLAALQEMVRLYGNHADDFSVEARAAARSAIAKAIGYPGDPEALQDSLAPEARGASQ